ncbi:hypothetical protein [Micromonospora sp. NPDC049204]|uniref:hypothetical protein n=1 Tax=Micromonospora sp. NPDC049204 TaxID=3154351 RepID=UPI0033C808BD
MNRPVVIAGLKPQKPIEHAPNKPGWDCLQCEQPWPCAPAKVTLSELYQGEAQGLAMSLAGYYYDAANDLPGTPREELYQRIVAWSRPTCSKIRFARR